MPKTREYPIKKRDRSEQLQFFKHEEALKKALQLDPASEEALVGLARLALMKKEGDVALQLLQRVLKLHPNHAEALALKGILFMDREEFQQAIEFLERARSADSNLAMVYFNLGRSYCEIGQLPAPEEFLQKALDMNPDHFQALSQLSYIQIETGRVEEGIQSMLQAIRINPLYLKGYLILGSLYENAGKGELMLRLYRCGLRHNPNAFPLRERLCSLYALKMDFRSAYVEALEIVRRRSASQDYLRLGIFAVALRKLEIAEKAFQSAIDLNPRSWEGHYNLGELYLSANLTQQAKEHYERAVALNCGSHKPLNGMGLYLLLVDQNCDAAIQLFKQALELAPARPEPRLNLALAYAKKGDARMAGKFAESVLSLTNPGDALHGDAQRLQLAIREETLRSDIQGHTLRSLQ